MRAATSIAAVMGQPQARVALILAMACAPACARAEDEDWTRAGEAAGSGVIGMSSDELASYAADQEEDAGGVDEKPQSFVRNRRRFVVREFRFNADWDTDPTSLPAMIEQFKRQTGMDAQAMQPRQPLTVDSAELGDWPFVFMTAHNAFTFSDADLANLKRWLEHGGFLQADDCLYGFPFGSAFHGEMRKVFPDKELKPVPLGTPALANVLKQKFAWPDTNEAGLPKIMSTNPFEYLEVGGRMAVLYTPPDIGCMWEISSPPTPSNPLGVGMHNMDFFPGMRDAAYKMAVNIVIYAMSH